MATDLLIYHKVVPVVPISKDSHQDLSIKLGKDYSFAGQINSVPLLATEFANAAREYSIIFTASEDDVMSAAILGIKDNHNLYLTETGEWQANYIPAFY